MFNTNIPYSVPVTPYGTNGNGNGFFGGDSWAWIIVLLLLFGWGGNGGFGGFGGFGGGGYSEVQRGFDHNSVINKLDGLTYGLSDSTYALNNAITGGFHSVQSQLAECCCATQRSIDGVNFNMAKGFCDLGNVVNNSTRDILESNNANTRAILDFLTNDKISTLQAENQSLKFQASQAAQNAFITANQEAQTATLIRRLGADCPVPAYVVPNPNCCYNPLGFNFGNGYGTGGCGCA